MKALVGECPAIQYSLHNRTSRSCEAAIVIGCTLVSIWYANMTDQPISLEQKSTGRNGG